MDHDATLARRARRHLEALCACAPDRRPGSGGNTQATRLVADALERSGWRVARQRFDVLDWESSGAAVRIGGRTIAMTPSPYGLGTDGVGPVRILRTRADLARDDLTGAVVVLDGELASRPLTPKSFPFYRSDEDAEVIERLERVAPAAVIAVTGRYPALCGALDPFPLIEDGDFAIPTANVRPSDAVALLRAENAAAHVEIRAERRMATAANVVGTLGPGVGRITVIAHLDAKPGTSGAVDNAAGVVVLLLLAELLHDAELPVGVELLAVNGEDHFAAPGEMAWLEAADLEEIALVVNIDGAGYRRGLSAFSTYNLDGTVGGHVERTLQASEGLVAGPQWYQSDHAIFAMRGRAAVAITTELLEEMLETLYHSEHDTPDQVDEVRLLEIAHALRAVIAGWPQ